MHRRLAVLAAGPLTVVAVLGACGSDDGAPTEVAPVTDATPSVPSTSAPPAATAGAEQRYPDVIAATADPQGDGTWRFDVTVSSPYDTPVRYADAWRIVGDDGQVYGVRELTHDHQAEQPFTRSLSGIVIPDGVETVTIEGRDRRFGWGGGTVDVVLGDG